jgi:hypothetical protein
MPNLDAIYDDLVYLKNELRDLRNKYEEEQRVLSENIKTLNNLHKYGEGQQKPNKNAEIISKSNLEDIMESIMEVKGVFENRFTRVNEIIAKIDDKMMDVAVGLTVLSAEKIKLDENASIDNQFFICCEKVKQVNKEFFALFDH